MERLFIRFLTVLAVLCAAISANAGTLTLKSPTQGSFLGLSNTLKFLLTGSVVDVTVKAVLTGPAGTTEQEKTFTPNSENKVDDSLPLNFNESTPEGNYTLTVSATEPGNTYAPKTVTFRVDTVRPKFLESTPGNGQSVKGIVRVRATLKETNLKSWDVKINGQAIPNNTGTTTAVAVDWDTSGIEFDGSQSITITARDLSGNEAVQNISATLDRIAPIVTIAYPRSDSQVLPGTTIPVLIDIADASTSSIDGTGIDVVAKTLSGTYLTRVSRLSVKGSGSNILRWTGRILYKAGLLPRKFKITVTAIDKAGNRAANQEVVVTVR